MAMNPRHTLQRTLALALVLLCPLAAGAAEDPIQSVRTKLADAAFRFLSEQPDGGKSFVMPSLAVPDGARLKVYEWLRSEVKPVKEQALECRMLAWLARDLKRPEEEILKADDLVLQAAPDLPEGWLNRAEFYAASPGSEKAAWALDMAAHAIRRVNLSEHGWRGWLKDMDLAAWRERAAQAGKVSALVDALSDALKNTPHGEARLEAAALVLDSLRDKAFQEHPDLAVNLLDAVKLAQPHLGLADPSAFADLARSFEAAGQKGVAGRIAQLLILAPIPKDFAAEEEPGGVGFATRWREAHPAPATPDATASELERARHAVALAQHEAVMKDAMALRGGWRTLQHGWEDTTPRYQSTTQARVLLSQAMSEDGVTFARAATEAAKEQPWNEGLISHALLAMALNGDLDAESLTLASALKAEQRGRIALRLCAFAPTEKLPMEAIGPWLAEGSLMTLHRAPDGQPVERAAFESVLQGIEALEKAGDPEKVTGLLVAALDRPPRALDADQWDRLSHLVLRHGTVEQTKRLADTWSRVLGNEPVEKDHLAALTRAALRGGPEKGRDFAAMILGVWERRFAENAGRTAEDAVAASRVAEALLACEDFDGFATFVAGLKQPTGTGKSITFSRMTEELDALRQLLAGEGTRMPAVDAWVQSPEAEGQAPRVHWQFVFPELDRFNGRVPPIRIEAVIGGREAAENMSAETTADARWWAAGTPHPLLARLAGRFDLDILVGETPRTVRTIANLRNVGAAGAVEVPGLPDTGCLRAVLRSRSRPVTDSGNAQPFSLKTPVFLTGREPDATTQDGAVGPAFQPHPTPPTWDRQAEERWGRLIGPPIVIEEGTEYLLTKFAAPPGMDEKPVPVSLILLDEKQRPLGAVPLVSAGFQAARGLPAIYTPHRAHTQRFRASDWGWADDAVCLREKTEAKGEQTTPARYMAFVTRSSGGGPLPLLQLRPYREPVSGTGAESISDPSLVEMPELNGEYVATVGFRPRSWHITMGPGRGIFGGEGRLAGFDVVRIPWKPMMRVESPLLKGNEWPMCFESSRALVVEPSWSGDRSLGLRFVPFGEKGNNYAACERRELPLPTYNRGELSIHRDGALMLVSSQNRDNPEPVAAWIEPDGRCHVCPLPRPPLKGSPGLEIAWWGPPAPWVTLHEDGMLFHLEHVDGLRLRKSEPGSPDDMPEGARPPKSKKRPQWKLERPDILTEHDTTTGAMVRRFHLAQPCEAKPMSFSENSPVFLFTTEHDIIRVNPPPRKRPNDE